MKERSIKTIKDAFKFATVVALLGAGVLALIFAL
jgi:hypothetical protein